MNVLVIMSDEHSYSVMGNSGHPIVLTPNLDRLARQGTNFCNCYTPSPVCTPARASFITGHYVHNLGTWDNATPFDGQTKSLPTYLNEAGKELVSFGKLDLHPDGVYEGLKATLPEHRSNPQVEAFFRGEKIDIGTERRFQKIGITDKAGRDDEVRDLAVEWLRDHANDMDDWVLYVGFKDPHFPFFVSQESWDRYDATVTDVPDKAKGPFDELNAPLQALRAHFRGDCATEDIVRKAHVGYYAMTSRLDRNVGEVLNTLAECGLDDTTLVIYTSDHGEQLGHHGLWWKCCMYEESAHVPLLLRGPGVLAGKTIDTPVSLLDMVPTICEAAGAPIPENLPGYSLLSLARGDKQEERPDFAFSEYHAHGVDCGMFMIRWKSWKYVYYPGYSPQLFNLDADPEEDIDLVPQAAESSVIREAMHACHDRLLSVCAPDSVSDRARRDQAKLRSELEIKHARQRPISVPHPQTVLPSTSA